MNLNDLAGSMSDLERRRRNRATSGLNRNISRPSRGRVLTSMSSSSNLHERLDRAQSAANMTSNQGSSEAMMETTGSRPPIWSRSHTRSPKPGSNSSMVADTGRTIEQVFIFPIWQIEMIFGLLYGMKVIIYYIHHIFVLNF